MQNPYNKQPLIPMTEYEGGAADVRGRYDDQIAKHGRITNMKRTLLHSPKAFDVYMEWYALRDLLLPIIGDRAVSLFSYAISAGNDCLICSTFFRKILIDSGDDPDHPALSETERFLMDFGKAFAQNPHKIPQGHYDYLSAHFNSEQQVLLIAFAGIMAATNLFNTAAKVPLDELLYSYTKDAAD
ncbi:MAG: hypothetical protein LBT21_01320 [Oscillospiraceae bacterium]|jgi:alkylhydroperoxidase family enzyme|nr:hypothetical protein [Oscillospiraceae bacterium]